MSAVAVACALDPILDVVAPIVLASAHPTALVVDVGRDGIPLPGERTLADLVADGPRLADLTPGRAGVAVLPNGGVSETDSAAVVAALAERWPVTVVRGSGRYPRIPVVPLFPGVDQRDSAVYVSTGLVEPQAGDAPVVPGPSRAAVRRVFGGGSAPRRLVAAWSGVWGFPWR